MGAVHRAWIKMRLLVLVVVFLAAVVTAQEDVSLAKKQYDLNGLLYRVLEPIRTKYTDIKEYSKTFDPLADLSIYADDGKVTKSLMDDIKDGRILKQKNLFSLFNTRHREEALMLFETLMNTNNWIDFTKNAAYFRTQLNEGVYLYAMYVAVIHSDLANGLVLPPLYEITPHMFTNNEAINKAYTSKMEQVNSKFRLGYTASERNREQRVAYFGEDIGFNIHHVTWHMDHPFWWKDTYGKTTKKFDRKGELFFWVHHQLTARFDAERLSNNLPEVDELYWDRPIKEGFAPHTQYKYGGEFPSRPDNIKFSDVDGVARIRDMLIMESRIRDAIDHGYIVGHSGDIIDIMNDRGIDIIGDVIESSTYSPNPEYYGALHNIAHMMLGRQGDPKGKFKMPPGVMEHFETATRDPSFFRLHKMMDNIFKLHKNRLPVYTKEDLDFPGVHLNHFSVNGKLETYFEDFEFDLVGAVDDTEQIADVELTAIVPRINHKPFSYDFDIFSEASETVLATIRIFLCPLADYNGVKYDADSGRWGCIDLDKFWRQVKPGNNHFVRSAKESSVAVPDIPSFKTLIEKADHAYQYKHEPQLTEFQRSCGIPQRLLIPKGTVKGLDFQLWAFVTDGSNDATLDDLHKDEYLSHSHCGIPGEKFPDSRPMGFPLDRKIPDARVFHGTTNFKNTIVKISHLKSEF